MNLTVSSSCSMVQLVLETKPSVYGKGLGGGQMITKAGQDLDCALRRRRELKMRRQQ